MTDDATAEPTPGAADPARPARPGRVTSPWFVLAVSLAVLFGIAAAVLAVLLAGAGGDDPDDLRAAAGRFGEALVTYDHDDPEAHREAVLAGATGSFAEEYGEAFDRGLGELITDLQASSQGFVKDVFLTDVERGQALAIVVLDVENDGTAGPRTLYDVYVRLTMVEVDGSWLVDDVADLSFGSGAGIGADAPADAGGEGGTDVTTDTTSTTATSVP